VTTVGIGQPTFLPWLGYLDLMDQVDVFVLLDDVQFERHSWQHRNRIKGPAGEILLSVPVRRTGLATLICEAEIADRRALPKMLRTIEQCYARAKHLDEVRFELGEVFSPDDDRLLDLLLRLIGLLRCRLAIETPLLRSSTLDVTGSKDVLVRSICEAVGASRYLAAPGSRAYMEDGGAFDESPIEVRYHDFVCQPYAQLHGAFVEKLSALDAVLNLGAGAREVLISGRRPPRP